MIITIVHPNRKTYYKSNNHVFSGSFYDVLMTTMYFYKLIQGSIRGNYIIFLKVKDLYVVLESVSGI